LTFIAVLADVSRKNRLLSSAYCCSARRANPFSSLLPLSSFN
jgi:hypothetical protein